MSSTAIFFLLLFILPITLYRYSIDGELKLIGNISNLNRGLYFENSLVNLLSFNPLKVLEVTFNSPWNDSLRREYVWEYLFKSIFFGEFKYQSQVTWVCTSILLFAILLLPFFAYGIYKSFKNKEWLLLSFLVVPLALFWLNRVSIPVSTVQDFRYLPMIIIPVSYFLVIGIKSAPLHCAIVGEFLSWGVSVFCSIFIIYLFV